MGRPSKTIAKNNIGRLMKFISGAFLCKNIKILLKKDTLAIQFDLTFKKITHKGARGAIIL
jgi:hypothetical protein